MPRLSKSEYSLIRGLLESRKEKVLKRLDYIKQTQDVLHLPWLPLLESELERIKLLLTKLHNV